MRQAKKKRRSDYRLLGLVGQGQFGQVYCAVHRRTKALVALKNLDRRRFPTRDFLREFSFIVTLRHPHIVACQAIAHAPVGRQMVMDYCEGGTLRDLMEGNAPLSLKQRLELVGEILSGLAHAHAKAIVHCDLKPENILLNVTPTSWTARISDFGLARFRRELGGQSTTETGDSGSPAYMAPERFYGQFSPASDIYAVGIMLYELVCGDRPFSGTYGELMTAHLNRELTVPESVPIVLRTPIVTATQKLPQARFATATDMLKSVQLAIEVIDAIERDAASMVSAPPEPAKPRSLPLTRAIAIASPVTHLAATSNRLWVGTRETLAEFELSAAGIEANGLRTLASPHPIRDLHACERGCVLVTESDRAPTPEEDLLEIQPDRERSLFWIPVETTEPDLARYQKPVGQEPDLFVALEPSGRWASVASGNLQAIDRSLLGELWPDREAAPSSTFDVFKLPEWERTPLVLDETFPTQVVAIDRRHGLALFPPDDIAAALDLPADALPLELNLRPYSARLFARRSGWADSLPVPIALDRLVSSRAQPLQVLGIEPDAPTPTAVLLQIHPLRLTRIALEVLPDFIAATVWGFLLVQHDGRVLALDEAGQRLGYRQLEADGNVTAIAVLAEFRIAIAHGDASRSRVSVVDVEDWITAAIAARDGA